MEIIGNRRKKNDILLQKFFQPIVWRDGSTFGQMLEEEVFLRLSILETGLGWFINFKRQYFAEIWCGYRVATKTRKISVLESAELEK